MKNTVTRVLILLLMLSLGIRSIVPMGMMVSNTDGGLLGFEITLCDGSNSLGSIPVFKKHVEPTHLGHDAKHHQENSRCEECDFLWASSGFDDGLAFIHELEVEYQHLLSVINLSVSEVRHQQRFQFQQRAPPLYIP
jgi:hypothetical protein